MRILLLSVASLIIVSLAGCGFLRDITAPTPTPTPGFRKQPEPQRPLVWGEVSGVRTDMLITVHIKSIAGREAHAVTRRGSGIWQAVVTDASGLDYIITAEAEGYISEPISYTIHLEGEIAYLVENGSVSDKEAVGLDFRFELK